MIAIKDMKIPETCSDCKLCYQARDDCGELSGYRYCIFDLYTRLSYKDLWDKRSSKCPLIEIEPTTKDNLGVDCISRQAVLNLPRKQLKNYFGEVTGEVIDIKDIVDLPSVTPQEPMVIPIAEVKFDEDKLKELVDKAVVTAVMPNIEPRKGKWIVAKGGSYLGTRNACCSNCKDFYTNDWRYMNYCPNCGADMRESEEEE